VGSVTLVDAVVVSVRALLPLVLRLLASVNVFAWLLDVNVMLLVFTVIVLVELLTPVPPWAASMTVPFQTPVVIVPTLAKLLRVVTAVLTSVPVLGKVTFVSAVTVNVRPKLPLVLKLLSTDIVFA
jgi:hypothetical protein